MRADTSARGGLRQSGQALLSNASAPLEHDGGPSRRRCLGGLRGDRHDRQNRLFVDDLRLAPAIQTLDALIAAGEAGSYDLVFIDALKTEYQVYFERALILLRQGGIAAIDNTLWDGRVIDEKDTDPLTLAIREFNARLSRDRRVHVSMLVIGDGMTLALKK